MIKRCLYCYLELNDPAKDFHTACSRKIFDATEPPLLDISEHQLTELAQKIIASKEAVTGVQPKLSLGIDWKNVKKGLLRFTIMGLMDNYILKPPSEKYRHLPELEDLTMHLARISKIETVPHSLVKMQSGELAYLTKRIDRSDSIKINMEDMCQLTERLTEAKYQGSYEQIAKVILKFSTNFGLDVINFYEQVVFSFLTGNADMHLKNFSLIDSPGIGYRLSPAYDLVATELVVEGDNEELALTLNTRKRKIKQKDFLEAFTRADISSNSAKEIFNKLKKAIPEWNSFIDISFLPANMKEAYKNLIAAKIKQIDL